MTGMPWACALSITWAPAPFRSTRSITLQPLVSCWSARVAYLPVSFRAFWMSVSKPIALNCDSSAGRSPFSQRLDESASGSMMQARLAAAEEEAVSPLPESSSEPQAASEVIPMAAANATAAVLLNVIVQNSICKSGGKRPGPVDLLVDARRLQAGDVRLSRVRDHIVVRVDIVDGAERDRPSVTRTRSDDEVQRRILAAPERRH